MSEPADFRSWAARVASQAAKQRDESEVLRLMSIAVYWERLADLEDWQRDNLTTTGGKVHQRPPQSHGEAVAFRARAPEGAFPAP